MVTEQPRVNQWEAPRKDYSSNSRPEERTRQSEEERSQPYSKNEVAQPNRNREHQFQPTKYELKREGSRSFNKQESDEYPQRNQETQNRNQRPYTAYTQSEVREQYPEQGNKYGGQTRGGRNAEKEEYSGSNQQQSYPR